MVEAILIVAGLFTTLVTGVIVWRVMKAKYQAHINQLVTQCEQVEEDKQALLEELFHAKAFSRLYDHGLEITYGGFWYFDLVSDHGYCDEKNARLLELGEAEMCPLPDAWPSLFHPDDYDEVMGQIAQAIESAGEMDVTYRLRTLSGKEKYFRTIGLVIVDKEGNTIRQIGLNFDITQHVRAQLDMRQAQYYAEKASHNTAQFLANISHEIRTPMNGIVGMTELLTTTTLNDIQQNYIDILNHSSEVLTNILNDILDYSKLEEGNMDLETVAFRPQELVRKVLNLFQRKAEEKRLWLTACFDPHLPDEIIGDPTRFQQILLNLINNGLKFTNLGGVHINLRREGFRDQQMVLRLEVMDSGIGIPEDTQASVFERFTKADHSTTRKYGGTGLGLSIVKRIVELWQGSIGLESKEGEGSTFWVTLVCTPVSLGASPAPEEELDSVPRVSLEGNSLWLDSLFHQKWLNYSDQRVTLRSSDYPVNALYAVKEHNKQVELPLPLVFNDIVKQMNAKRQTKSAFQYRDPSFNPQYTHIRVMIVDDNAINRMVIKKYLNQFGIAPLEAHDGQQAVSLFEQQAIDAIFMDCEMPILDGWQASRVIKSMNKPVTIIGLSAHASNKVRDKAKQFGMDDYMTKPVKLGDISGALDMVQEYLEQVKQG